MIQFEKVTVKFPLGNIALDNISFQIADNEFVYLVGPSGAGKTTIIRLILNEFMPTTGKIQLDKWELTTKNFRQKSVLRQKVGVVFQDFKILPEKNIFENIALSLLIQGANFRHVKNEVEKALNLVGLAGKGLVFPAQLSAGELQRVAIARAFVGKRDYLLADEPTGNLDPQTTWEIMKIFKRLEKARTIIFATHNVDIVNSLRRRVIVLKNGKIVKDKPKSEYSL